MKTVERNISKRASRPPFAPLARPLPELPPFTFLISPEQRYLVAACVAPGVWGAWEITAKAFAAFTNASGHVETDEETQARLVSTFRRDGEPLAANVARTLFPKYRAGTYEPNANKQEKATV